MIFATKTLIHDWSEGVGGGDPDALAWLALVMGRPSGVGGGGQWWGTVDGVAMSIAANRMRLGGRWRTDGGRRLIGVARQRLHHLDRG
jgi:hypothetical protein